MLLEESLQERRNGQDSVQKSLAEWERERKRERERDDSGMSGGEIAVPFFPSPGGEKGLLLSDGQNPYKAFPPMARQ